MSKRLIPLLWLLWSSAILATPTPIALPTTELYPTTQDHLTQRERPRTATTTYWQVKFILRAPDLPPESNVRVLMPISDTHQEIRERHIRAPGFRFGEEPTSPNLVGVWTRSNEPGAGEIEVEYEFAVTDRIQDVPAQPSTGGEPSDKDVQRWMQASPLIQSKDPVLRQRAREVAGGAHTPERVLWNLYQFTSTAVGTAPSASREDALMVLQRGRGSVTGKARLLTALLQASGIPARIVGGLSLDDAAKKRATIAWVEAFIGGTWIPLDPSGGHYGWLPNRYLALYRGDLPLIVHPAGANVDYEFVVRRVRKTENPGKTSNPERITAPLQPIARLASAYVEQPLATVVVFTDQNLPATTTERIFREATEAQIDLIILTVPPAPRYFRQQYLQRLIANNLSLVQHAHVLVLHTSDDSGLYGALVLGEANLKMGDARLLIAGRFPKTVGTTLGSVLFTLLDAGEVVLFPEPPKLAAIWALVRANVLDGTPIEEESRKWAVKPAVVNFLAYQQLGTWRKAVVSAWARAVTAQVPLQALTFILVLPLIAALVVVIRIVVGIETFGTFAPVIVSLAFLTTGLKWGLVIFTAIVGTGSLVRAALQKVRLQLVARLAILITVVAGIMAGLAVLGASFGIGALLNVSIFPMVIMSNMIEHFAASRAQFGTREAVRLTANTLGLAALCYAAVEWGGLQSLLLSFPELLVAAIAVDVLLGKWRGLRILEYKRFWSLAERQQPWP
ncbi:MAG: hypothetical protein KatS3mg077_3032 [Candidatus Binatia bacterium]|nr:MAG: hypothetical protein KatS3mg077_3032 [Candidatus Binatia bacterium]